MDTNDWLTLAVANIPAYFVLGWLFFRSWRGFGACLRAAIIRQFTGHYTAGYDDEKRASSFIFWVWVGLCVACVVAEAQMFFGAFSDTAGEKLRDQQAVLGEVVKDEGPLGGYRAEVAYDGRMVKVHLDRERSSLDTTVGLAADVVSSLAELDGIAKTILIRDLLAAHYDSSEGGLMLSAEQFADNFQVGELHIRGDRSVQFWYEDLGNLFNGRSVFVWSVDGLNFDSASAKLGG